MSFMVPNDTWIYWGTLTTLRLVRGKWKIWYSTTSSLLDGSGKKSGVSEDSAVRTL